jgi:adenine-specific DNA-methyltransferase
MQDTLFEDLVTDAPSTEGIKYTGSKLKLLPHILSLSHKVNAKTVFDGFSGSTRVSQAYAKSGYTVIANDIAVYSKIFNTAYLLNTKTAKSYQEIINHLNNLPPVDGWFTQNYGGDGNGTNSVSEDGLKKPWQKKNTMRLDAIREEIDRLNLDEVTKAVCIASLILAMDQVDSTLGHFVSYLNDWSPRSYKDMKLVVPELFINKKNNTVLNYDIFDAMKHIGNDIDLAYYDPPYGSNNEKMPPSRVRYQSYYHIWTTICLNDKPELFGKAKRRTDTSDIIAGSIFEEFRKGNSGRFIVVEAIERLIKETPTKYIILSYSSGGRATASELNDVMNSYGKLIEVEEIDYKKNVMATMKWTNDWIKDIDEKNKEFLFLMEKK